MHHDLLQLDHSNPAQRELQVSAMNDGRRASDAAARRCVHALARAGEETFTMVPLARQHDGKRSLTVVQRFYTRSGVLLCSAEQCQN